MRADGARAKAAGSALSDFLRRALHSLTARRQPRNPATGAPAKEPLRFDSQPPIARRARADQAQGSFVNPEDVRALSAKNLPDQPAAVSCAAHDLLDRDPLLGEGENGRVRLLAADVSFILQFLGKGQKRRVDHRGPHRRWSCRIDFGQRQERRRRIFHQMPAVGDLDGMGKRPLGRDRVAASTIPGDDANLRLMRQPGLSRHGLPIGQKCDRPTPLKVADQRAVAVVTSPRPIVDADNRGRRKASRSTPTHHAQQGVIAHLNVEPTRKRGRRSASERNREAVHDIVEPPGASGSWLDGLEPFSKDPPCAGLGIADEAAGPQNQRYPGPSGRKIRRRL